MRITVFGLGYVGCVTAACFARRGHHVVGVDVDRGKVDLVNAGHSPVVEEGMDTLVAEQVEAGRLRATTNAEDGFADSTLSFIAVGTPSQSDGSLETKYLLRVCEQIGQLLPQMPAGHTVVIRSTVLPGTTRSLLAPALEKVSGQRVGEHFQLCTNPEFLREGSSIADFEHPPFIIIGERTPGEGAAVEAACQGLNAETFCVPWETAEMLKYACNAFHAHKIVFANEIGRLGAKMELDGRQVMALLCRDDRLNISKAYLRPGFAFGGSCLGKDLRALLARAGQLGVETPALGAILPANCVHLDAALDAILTTGKKKVGLLGLAFKQGTDDLRESPMVILAERLIEAGCTVSICDPRVEIARLRGANRRVLEEELPQLARLLIADPRVVVRNAEVVVITTDEPEILRAAIEMTKEQILFDLTGVIDDPAALRCTYRGICW